jgi:hypothetical protein
MAEKKVVSATYRSVEGCFDGTVHDDLTWTDGYVTVRHDDGSEDEFIHDFVLAGSPEHIEDGNWIEITGETWLIDQFTVPHAQQVIAARFAIDPRLVTIQK